MEQLILMIFEDNQMLDMMRRIKEIDKEHNGYVTSTELDDIIKLSYPQKLKNYNLKQMFKPYASI
jgi:Ca2+-binding EF-hand superfamily protein